WSPSTRSGTSRRSGRSPAPRTPASSRAGPRTRSALPAEHDRVERGPVASGDPDADVPEARVHELLAVAGAAHELAHDVARRRPRSVPGDDLAQVVGAGS